MGGSPCEPSQHLRCISLRDHGRCKGCRHGAGYHVNPATGAFCGVPNEATKRLRSLPKWAAGHHVNPATGAFGRGINGVTKRVR
eukprot:2262223-Pyramimonas_sp.AAC.1